MSRWVEYAGAVFGSTGLDLRKLAEWLYGKTLGHPYFLAFICRELWSHYHARPFANAMHLWPVVFSRLEQAKFNTDLAQLSEKEVALLRAVAQGDHDEFILAPFVRMFPHQYFKRLAERGLLIRAGRGRGSSVGLRPARTRAVMSHCRECVFAANSQVLETRTLGQP